MRITISGPPGSGKTTVCKKLSEILGFEQIIFGNIFRGFATKRGITLAELGKLAEEDPSLDAEIDNQILKTARERDDIIIESRICAYILSRNNIPALKIYLSASEETRTKRITVRENSELEKILEETKIRQASESKRYLTYYNIDINDLSVYDLIINTDNLTPDDVTNRILDAVRVRKMLVKDSNALYDRWGKSPSNRSVGELLEGGVIALDKPQGPTSHQATAWARDVLHVKKISHGGTLDPQVSGVLPVATGDAVRLTDIVLSSDKEYVCLMTLHADCPEKKIRETMGKFVGKIYQIPPVRSAVSRKLRIRHVHELEILEIDGRNVLFRVVQDAGTYIRTLCVDIGDALLCGASMRELRRTRSGRMNERSQATLQNLSDAYSDWQQNGNETEIRSYVKPMEELVKPLPWIVVKPTAIDAICHGSDLYIKGVHLLDSGIRKNALVALMSYKGELIAIGTMQMSSENIMKKDIGVAVKVKRVFMKQGRYPPMWKKSTDLEGLSKGL